VCKSKSAKIRNYKMQNMALQKSVKVWVKGEMQYCENACSIARALV